MDMDEILEELVWIREWVEKWVLEVKETEEPKADEEKQAV